jgi:hypothetical protein
MLVVLALVGVTVVGVGQVSDVQAASTQDTVYVATGENFPDALGVGPVAALGNAPVLFVLRDSIPGATLNELNRLQPDTIIIVGGEGVVSPAVAQALSDLAFGPTVERLAGADRFSTAAEVSKSLFPTQINADTLNGLHPSAYQSLAWHTSQEEPIDIGPDDEVILSLAITAPRDGVIIANSSTAAISGFAGTTIYCAITTGSRRSYDDPRQAWESPGVDGDQGQLAGTRGFDVKAAQFIKINLVCESPDSVMPAQAILDDPVLTAMFFPNP